MRHHSPLNPQLVEHCGALAARTCMLQAEKNVGGGIATGRNEPSGILSQYPTNVSITAVTDNACHTRGIFVREM